MTIAPPELDEQQKQRLMDISTQGVILIVVAATMMSFGSLGLKGAIDAIGGFGSSFAELPREILALVLNPIFIVGLGLYGGGTLIWMRVLSTEPISIGYPILMGIAFLTITLGAAFFFDEAITFGKIVGMAIILVGVIVASLT